MDNKSVEQTTEESLAAEKAARKKKAFSIFTWVLFVVLLGVFCYSGYMWYSEEHEYTVAKDEYEHLAQTYAPIATPAEAGEESATGKKEAVPYPDLKVDFDALCSLNPDVIGWIYMSVADVNYPIMYKAGDDEYYLHHTLEGTYNSSGSIFLDGSNTPDFFDYNSVLYGHNMKNGTMFGTLKEIRKQEGLLEQDPYFYIYLKGNEVLQYRVVAYYVDSETCDTYTKRLCSSSEEYREYLDMAMKKSEYGYNMEMEGDNLMVTLATCSGYAGTTQRLWVHGICIGDYVNGERL